MPTTYKVLGQSNPSATTATTLYTVPSATQAVVSTIVIANLTASSATFRIAVRANLHSFRKRDLLNYGNFPHKNFICTSGFPKE